MPRGEGTQHPVDPAQQDRTHLLCRPGHAIPSLSLPCPLAGTPT